MSLERAHSALELLAPGEEYVASFPQGILAWSNQALGNEDAALGALQRALGDQSTRRDATARLLLAQGVVYLVAGKLHQVEHTARHLLQIAQEARLRDRSWKDGGWVDHVVMSVNREECSRVRQGWLGVAEGGSPTA